MTAQRFPVTRELIMAELERMTREDHDPGNPIRCTLCRRTGALTMELRALRALDAVATHEATIEQRERAAAAEQARLRSIDLAAEQRRTAERYRSRQAHPMSESEQRLMDGNR